MTSEVEVVAKFIKSEKLERRALPKEVVSYLFISQTIEQPDGSHEVESTKVANGSEQTAMPFKLRSNTAQGTQGSLCL